MRAIDADVLKALINVHYTNLVYNIKHSMSNVSQNEDFISGVKDGYLRILSDIKNMPTIELKHGRWIWNNRLEEWYCSNCDRIMTPYTVEKSEGEYEMAQPFYCGWCGARMDKVEE